MSRNLTPAVIAQLAASSKKLAILMHGQFKSADAYFWTGIGTLDWNGHTWLGSGALIDISVVPETTEIMASQIMITLSGIDSSLLALMLQEGGHNFTGDLWLAFFDGNDQLIDDPIQIDRGLYDYSELVEKADGSVLQIFYQNQLADLERPRLLNYTDADQQRLSPGDRGFEFVPKVQDWSGRWGPSAVSAPPPPPSGGGK